MTFFYAGSVKKIQAYITKTNKLREIAGASELVQYICTELFDEVCSQQNAASETIIRAAGNIRATFKHRDDLAKVMRVMPKIVAEKAPGLQFIQAAIPIDNDNPTYDDVQQLEKMLRQQLPVPTIFADWSITRKCPRTGAPAVASAEGKPIDAETRTKRDYADKHWLALRLKLDDEVKFPSDIRRLADANSFVAVIHADGNNLGQTLMALKDSPTYHLDWKEFSQKLDDVTTSAAAEAFRKHFKNDRSLRFRPIILGGDDLTVICAPDQAIDFTQTYLELFARKSREQQLGQLTACAGIAFVKQNFPFYYSLELAETLCNHAKKRAKAVGNDPVPSSFFFATELGSYVDSSFEVFKQRHFDASQGRTLAFGPYATGASDQLPAFDDLRKLARFTRQYTPLLSGLRKLVSVIHSSQADANLYADRLEQIARERLPKSKAWEEDFLGILAKLTHQAGATTLREALFNAQGESPILDIMTCAKFACPQEDND